MAAVLEVATGLALMIDPALVVRLLLGADVSGMPLGRLAGIALLALGPAGLLLCQWSRCMLP